LDLETLDSRKIDKSEMNAVKNSVDEKIKQVSKAQAEIK
jgi:hypothetical protein